jgi:hypothetical protein
MADGKEMHFRQQNFNFKHVNLSSKKETRPLIESENSNKKWILFEGVFYSENPGAFQFQYLTPLSFL